jgi:hypothetical protein
LIYIFGDIHGSTNFKHVFGKKNFLSKVTIDKNSIVIVCGDFGSPWFHKDSIYSKSELIEIEWLDSQKWTTLFIDGNHENFYNLSQLPQDFKYGGNVGVLGKRIFHLKRGEVYTIDGKSFFCMGGAVSIDRIYRTEGVSWWREEIPSVKEFDNAINNLEKYNFEVDYVITHTASYRLTGILLNKPREELLKDPCSSFFDRLEEKLKFKHWFFGHLHVDSVTSLGNFHCLYKYYCELNPLTGAVINSVYKRDRNKLEDTVENYIFSFIPEDIKTILIDKLNDPLLHKNKSKMDTFCRLFAKIVDESIIDNIISYIKKDFNIIPNIKHHFISRMLCRFRYHLIDYIMTDVKIAYKKKNTKLRREALKGEFLIILYNYDENTIVSIYEASNRWKA